MAGRSTPDEGGRNWQNRVLDRSLKRMEEAALARALGPTTRIVQAAMELARETGGTSFTVQQVVDCAGVSLQTFYRHFGSKDALMLALVEEANEAETARIRKKALAVDDPLERLRVVVMTPVRTANRATTGSFGAVITRELRRLHEEYREELATLTAPYIELLEDAINGAAAAGLVHPEDATRDAHLILGFVSGSFVRAATGGAGRRPENEAYVWRFCLRALGAKPAVLARVS